MEVNTPLFQSTKRQDVLLLELTKSQSQGISTMISLKLHMHLINTTAEMHAKFHSSQSTLNLHSRFGEAHHAICETSGTFHFQPWDLSHLQFGITWGGFEWNRIFKPQALHRPSHTRHSHHAGSGVGCVMYTLEGTKRSSGPAGNLARNGRRTA